MKYYLKYIWWFFVEICGVHPYKSPYITITGGKFPKNIGKKGIIIQSYDFYDKSAFERLPCSWIQIDGILYRYFPGEFKND